VNGRRETLVIGQYDPNLGAKKPRDLVELDYGMSLSWLEAPTADAGAPIRRAGRGPSRSKVEKRVEAADALNVW
jgi:hypothetical protein